jgi:ABC-type uncharacterized transport system permease subunit
MAKDKGNILEPCGAILSYDQEKELEENMDQGKGFKAIKHFIIFLYN